MAKKTETKAKRPVRYTANLALNAALRARNCARAVPRNRGGVNDHAAESTRYANLADAAKTLAEKRRYAKLAYEAFERAQKAFDDFCDSVWGPNHRAA